MIEKIKELYAQLDHKGEFVELLAKDLYKSENTIRQHWITHWNIPEKYHPRVKDLLEKTLAIEKKCRDDKQGLIRK